MFKLVPAKKTSEIAEEWDLLAETRLRQILCGEDITYNQVLVPTILALVEKFNPTSVLDVGCGVGILTDKIASIAEHVVGIDPSKKSIELADARFGTRATFCNTSIEAFDRPNRKFDVIVANMVLMDCRDVKQFSLALRKHIGDRGRFIWSVTHPFFWPRYFGYDKEEWFDYTKELFIESPFRISLDNTAEYVSTHVHRPLSMLLNAISHAGFELSEILEPMPNQEVELQYPKMWHYPRYLVGVSSQR